MAWGDCSIAAAFANGWPTIGLIKTTGRQLADAGLWVRQLRSPEARVPITYHNFVTARSLNSSTRSFSAKIGNVSGDGNNGPQS